MSITAKNDPSSLIKLGKTLKCSKFKDNLEKGMKNPRSKEAKIVLRTIDPLVRISGSKIHGSPQERKMAISTLTSMVQFYGCPSVFFTFAPDDIHSILTLRMCCPTSNGNKSFPAVDDNFELIMRSRNEKESIINILEDAIDIREFNLHNLV